jgi:hypothetical protein
MSKTIVKRKIIRVVSGGCQKDFSLEEEEQAYDYFKNMSKRWCYASMYHMCEFQREE